MDKTSVFKRDLNDDSDGVHLTSFGVEVLGRKIRRKKMSGLQRLLCVGLLKRGIIVSRSE